jgi:HK97 family phage portal protein
MGLFSRDNPLAATVAAQEQQIARLQQDVAAARDFMVQEKAFDFTVLKSGYGEAPPIYSSEYLRWFKEWVYANVTVIAEAVADIHYELYRLRAGDKVEEVKEHPALELLYKVNPFQTKWEWVYLMWVHLLLQGESATYLAGKEKNPKAPPRELWTLRPDFLRIIPGDVEQGQYVYAYKYEVPGKEVLTFAPWEVLFMRLPDPENAYRGKGIIQAAADTVQTDSFMGSWAKNFFFNSARPDAVLWTDKAITQEQAQEIQSRWYDKYGSGGRNSQKVAVLGAGLQYQQTTQSIKDMDFLEGQRWERDKLMAIFRNTKMALGIVEDVNRANAEASEYVQIKYTIKPKMQRLCDWLNETLLPLFGEDLFLSFADPLPESEELKFKKWEIGLNRVYTVNELREEEGLDPVEGGDVLYMPNTQVPLGSDPAPVPLKVLAGEGKGLTRRHREIIAKIQNRNLTLKVARREARAAAKLMLQLMAKEKGEPSLETKDEREQMAKSLHAKTYAHADTAERKALTALQPILDAMEADALTVAKRKEFAFAENDYEERIAAVLGISEEELILAVGREVLDLLQKDAEFILTPELVAEFIRESTLQAATSFTTSTKEAIARLLEDGRAAGLSYPKIARQIRERFAELARFEAQRLVRTEMSRAATAGTLAAYEQSGVVRAKEWWTAEDERVCPSCGGMHGKVMGVRDEYFAKDDEYEGLRFSYGAIQGPPLHPQCRCALLPVLTSS